ncbi:hypothetical protein [Streptomyces anulatus]|uniref:hypothetical protein n=1 Tax=Streptomyces anulatus TaxID=1892 RepID=UPI002E34D456|nr:hypothetical protein [Streptomyces anulatus]
MARGGINKREMDRWARDFVKESNKSLERAQRRNPPRVSVQLDAASRAPSGGEGIESSGHLARLLLWLESRTGHGADIKQVQQEISDDAEILALQLEQRGLVKVLWAANGIYALHLSGAGLVETHRQKSLQKDRAARLRHTMDAFHRWLFDTAADRKPVAPELFLTTPAAYFAGSEITETELDAALAHLTQYELVEYLDTEPVTVAITSQGASCALTGGSVQDHINQPRPGTTYNNYMPNAKGVIIGEQQHFTQNNTDGVDPTLFVQLAGYIGQVSPILGLPESDRVELERVAQDLHDEATSGNPEPGRLRQFATQLKDKLLEGASTMAATQGIQMAEQALTALV